MSPGGPRRAIALEYDGSEAPRVSAIGQDALAEQIVAIARAHGVPMVENNELAGLLGQLDLGDQIPETLYLCIAQIIAFAYRLRGRVPEHWQEQEREPEVTPGGATIDAELDALPPVSIDPQRGQP